MTVYCIVTHWDIFLTQNHMTNCYYVNDIVTCLFYHIRLRRSVRAGIRLASSLTLVCERFAFGSRSIREIATRVMYHGERHRSKRKSLSNPKNHHRYMLRFSGNKKKKRGKYLSTSSQMGSTTVFQENNKWLHLDCKFIHVRRCLTSRLWRYRSYRAFQNMYS